MGVNVRCQMTWESPKKRWRKLYKGKLHVVSCKQLDAPETKEGSYRAANEWWLRKRAEIDLAADSGKSHRADYEEAVQTRKDMLRWIALEGGEAAEHRPLADRLRGEIRRLEADFARPEPPPLEKLAGLVRFPMPTSNMPEHIEWLGRVEAVREHRKWTQPPRADGTLAARVDVFIAMRKAEADSGQIKNSSYQAVRDRLPHLKTYAGEIDAAELDERTLSGFHGHLLARVGEGELSPQYAAHILSAAKTFVRHLWRERVLENLPRNLDTLQITVGPREIPTFDLDALGTILDHASEKTSLYLLLMMNCGMYQVDVADLRRSQVDLDAGRITRKRSKTERHANVPVVSYLLWDETLRLLRNHGGKHPTLAVTNEKGEPLLRTPIRPDGQLARVDNIKSAYERTCRKLGAEITPLMYLRKTSATILESSESFRGFTEEFLGHAPKTLAKARYARTDPEQFDRAVRWLGLKYGYVTTR